MREGVAGAGVCGVAVNDKPNVRFHRVLLPTRLRAAAALPSPFFWSSTECYLSPFPLAKSPFARGQQDSLHRLKLRIRSTTFGNQSGNPFAQTSLRVISDISHPKLRKALSPARFIFQKVLIVLDVAKLGRLRGSLRVLSETQRGQPRFDFSDRIVQRPSEWRWLGYMQCCFAPFASLCK